MRNFRIYSYNLITKIQITQLKNWQRVQIDIFLGRPTGTWKDGQHYLSLSESEVAQSCPTLCDPMDCSLPGSSIHGIFQAIVLDSVSISFSRGSSPPRDWTRVSCIVDRRFTIWAIREDLMACQNANENNNEISPHTHQDDYYLNPRKQQSRWGCGEVEILVPCWWEYKMIQSLWKTVMVPLKIKNRIAMWSSNSTSVYVPQISEIRSQRDVCTPMFITALFTIAKIWKGPKCPLTADWISNM